MEERSGYWWLGLVALVALIAGAIGGSIGGGTAAYLMSRATVTPTSASETSSGATQKMTLTEESAIIDVVKTVGPAVVTVVSKFSQRIDLFRMIPEEMASGSGVIVDNRGYILTNYHVVGDSQDVSIILSNGQTEMASLVGTDYPFTDLTVLKIEAKGLTAATLGNSDELLVGQRVVAIGSALESFRNTVTAGIVSALHRTWSGNGDILMEDLIQTDAAINPGNSGGALVNLAGQVVGINTMIIRQGETGEMVEGIGFAIPSNTVGAVVQQLIEKGKVSRPYLGIAHTVIAAQQGIYILRVVPDSPAGEADLRQGDILLKIDDDPIDSEHPLLNVLMKHEPREEVVLTIVRDGKEMKVKVTLAERE